VVLACFCTALFAWGFGFYGVSVYVAELHATRGWSASLISLATTLYYLGSALLLARVPGWIDRLGPRAVLLGGAVALLAGASWLALSVRPWEMFAGFLLMGLGWACTSTAALVGTLALWFDRRRGLAINLALNGASAGGFTIAPALVWLAHAHGLAVAVMGLGLALLVLLAPLVLTAGARPRPMHARAVAGLRPGLANRAQALRDPHFWSIAAPFGLAISAQVGLIVHQVSFLLPHLGAEGVSFAVGLTTVCAVAGRLGLGAVIDRVDQRRAAALGMAVQVVGELLLMSLPNVPGAVYLGCACFGVSVGNTITLPSLIIQREFSPTSFGLLVGLVTASGQIFYSFAPAVMGALHDLSGGYAVPLGLCAVLEAVGAVLLLTWRPGKQGVLF
jgi:MFS family permease